MDIIQKQNFIQAKAAEGRIHWSRHALAELSAESWTVYQVESALHRAEIIEDYAHLHRHLPDCLVLASIPDGTPIHAVIAMNLAQDYILIVTVYQPTEQEWYDDWRTRK
ncbi:MAG: DUF4258 domain-containing protein [Anaerolineae bacterium]|nr:DUF4258 domain-containing protein [Anaerolineae bacterium]